MEAVLSIGWTKEDDDFGEMRRKEDKNAYDVIGKMLFRMSNGQERTTLKLSHAEVAGILRKKLGHLCEEELWENPVWEEDDEEFESLLNELLARHRRVGSAEPKPSNDISNMDELILWEPGQTIYPNLENKIMQIRDYVAAVIFNSIWTIGYIFFVARTRINFEQVLHDTDEQYGSVADLCDSKAFFSSCVKPPRRP